MSAAAALEPDGERDYAAEMLAAIDEAIPDGDFVAPVLAGKLAAKLAEVDPDLLDGWLHHNAVHFLTTTIAGRTRSVRATARRAAGHRAFAEAVEGGEPLGHFAVHYKIDDGNTRRRFADLTRADLLYVADDYTASGKADLMLAAYYKAVAKRLRGPQRVAEVLTEAEVGEMYRSIVRPT